jgi:hypothetical protein
MTENIADKIYDLGFTSLELLAQADPDELTQETNLGTELISSLVEEAKKLIEEKETGKEDALAEETETEEQDLPEIEEKAEDHESQSNSAQNVLDTLHEDSEE